MINFNEEKVESESFYESVYFRMSIVIIGLFASFSMFALILNFCKCYFQEIDSDLFFLIGFLSFLVHVACGYLYAKHCDVVF